MSNDQFYPDHPAPTGELVPVRITLVSRPNICDMTTSKYLPAGISPLPMVRLESPDDYDFALHTANMHRRLCEALEGLLQLAAPFNRATDDTWIAVRDATLALLAEAEGAARAE